jgi:dsRNA-specific ribonuclease
MEWPTTINCTADGPEHALTFTFTYTLGGITQVNGDPKPNKKDAKQSGATKAWIVCQLWEREPRELLRFVFMRNADCCVPISHYQPSSE